MRITGIKVDKQSCPITGGETNLDAKTPSGALAEFYCAFNKRDLALMEQNWLPSADISMDGPLGQSRRGWPEIREVFQRIFASAASLRVEFYDYVINQFDTVFLAFGRCNRRRAQLWRCRCVRAGSMCLRKADGGNSIITAQSTIPKCCNVTWRRFHSR